VNLYQYPYDEVTLSPDRVTFTSLNWDEPQTVTVTAVDDPYADGDWPYTISARGESADPDYDGLAEEDYLVGMESDDDRAAVTVDPTSGLVTTEAGGIAEFSMVLTSLPTASVSIGITSSDPGEGTVNPASVTFYPADWDTPRVVRVTGVGDGGIDGDQTYTIVTAPVTSADRHYDGYDPDNVSVTNLDADD